MVKIIELLNKHSNKCYEKYKSVELKYLDNLKKEYYETRRTEKSLYPLVLFIINNNILDISVECDDKIYNKNNLKEINDDRITHTYNIMNDTLKWALNNNKKIPNTTLYFWISDRIPWSKNIDEKIPIYVVAKPKNTNFIIFPDNTFNCITLEEKYNGVCYDWDKVKKIILDKANKIEFEDKNNKMFFKGASTTKRNSKIRENLHELSKDTKWLSINLDAWYAYISMDKFSEYKYLLNLSGHYPWSNRLKYLFLMNSIIINVDIETVNTSTNIIEPRWLSFINLITKPNKHYINLKMKYYWSNNKDEKLKNQELNYNESVRIFKKLKKIFNNDTKNYLPIVEKGFKRVSKLQNEHIYEYAYNCIVRNSLVNFV